MAWHSEGVKTGVQVANTLLADTGALAAGNYSISILIAANIVLVATLEHRNAADNATIREFVFCVNATTYDYTFPEFFTLAVDERFRVTLRIATIAGAGFHVNLRQKLEIVP